MLQYFFGFAGDFDTDPVAGQKKNIQFHAVSL
jgi:hypothetical protein